MIDEAAGPEPRPGLTAFAHRWAKAMPYVPKPWDRRVEFLRDHATRLAEAIEAEHFDPAIGRRVGAALVDAKYAQPQALSCTMRLLDRHLLADLDMDGEQARSRVSELIETLIAGHCQAVRAQIMDGQENVRSSALYARERAETAQRAAESRLHHAALHDRVTRLPNRTLFTERVGQLLERPGTTARAGVCILDLDAFRAINDSLGPDVGDQLLIAVATRLGRYAAEAGFLLARFGDDEFALLIKDTTCPEDATKIADRALALLGEPFHIEQHDLPVRASAGVVERALTGGDPRDMIRAAEMALGWAQADGGNRWRLFNPELNADQVARHQLSAALPAALRHGEFNLDYQPVVDLDSGELAGVEALARWRHPELGLLQPAEFIGLAEATGQIIPLGRRLLQQACRDAAGWLRITAAAPYVSVNLSTRQLGHPGLVGEIAACLDRSGLPAHQLQLEITETAELDTGRETMKVLHSIAGLGVRLVLDDFGTGYANYGVLTELPLYGFKLDASLIRGLTDQVHRHADAVVTGMISLGHSLDLTITAEGIETPQQAARLHEMACHLGQGFNFGHPAPACEITARVRHGS